MQTRAREVSAAVVVGEDALGREIEREVKATASFEPPQPDAGRPEGAWTAEDLRWADTGEAVSDRREAEAAQLLAETARADAARAAEAALDRLSDGP